MRDLSYYNPVFPTQLPVQIFPILLSYFYARFPVCLYALSLSLSLSAVILGNQIQSRGPPRRALSSSRDYLEHTGPASPSLFTTRLEAEEGVGVASNLGQLDVREGSMYSM
jgi:hypothetical protein